MKALATTETSWRPQLNTRHPNNAPPDGVTRFHAFAYFVSIDEARNRRRFYRLDWHEALFDGGAVIRSWGRLGCKGRKLITFYPDRKSAQQQIDHVVKQRLRRGYRVLEVV